jgi:hypothetical protein
MKAVIVTGALGFIGALLLAACGSTAGPGSSTAATPTPTPAPTATVDLTAAASSAYAAAYNTMNSGVNADIPKQNKASTDPAGATAAINDMVSLRQTFDTAVAAITFPDADKSDAQAVLSADASLESALGTLAANTDNIPNYNSIFPTTLSAQSAFTAADAALSRDLGL